MENDVFLDSVSSILNTQIADQNKKIWKQTYAVNLFFRMSVWIEQDVHKVGSQYLFPGEAKVTLEDLKAILPSFVSTFQFELFRPVPLKLTYNPGSAREAQARFWELPMKYATLAPVTGQIELRLPSGGGEFTLILSMTGGEKPVFLVQYQEKGNTDFDIHITVPVVYWQGEASIEVLDFFSHMLTPLIGH